MNILYILSGILYFAMLLELIFGWSYNQNNKFYKKLFNPKIYTLTLVTSTLFLIKPILDLFVKKQFTYPILAIPFIYLILFKIINSLSLVFNKRNIIIIGRSDRWPKSHVWYIDSMLHYTAILLSIIIPIFLSHFLNKS